MFSPKIEKSSPQCKVKTAINMSNGHVPHLGGELRRFFLRPPAVYGKEICFNQMGIIKLGVVLRQAYKTKQAIYHRLFLGLGPIGFEPITNPL